MNLAVECVECFVETSADVPSAVPNRGIERLHLRSRWRDRIETFVLFLRNAFLLTHRAVVKLTHHFVVKRIAALDFALAFVRPTITGIQTNYIRETIRIKYTFSKLLLTRLQETLAYFYAIRRHHRVFRNKTSGNNALFDLLF